MEKTMEQKMYAFISENFINISDKVYKICHRPKYYLTGMKADDLDSMKEYDIQDLRYLYKDFADAIETFSAADMLPDDAYNEYSKIGHLVLREGAQAIRHFYQGRRWYEEPYDETCRLRNNN